MSDETPREREIAGYVAAAALRLRAQTQRGTDEALKQQIANAVAAYDDPTLDDAQTCDAMLQAVQPILIGGQAPPPTPTPEKEPEPDLTPDEQAVLDALIDATLEADPAEQAADADDAPARLPR